MLGTLVVQEANVPVRRSQFIHWDQNTVEFRYEPELNNVTEPKLYQVGQILQHYMGLGLKVKFLLTPDFLLSGQGKHRIMVRKDF